MIHILAFETSCDETSVAVVRLENNKIKILANIIISQAKTHQKYGGVVPEIAARCHAENIIPCLENALKQSFLTKNTSNKCSANKIYKPRSKKDKSFRFNLQSLISQKIDFISCTYGPGLSVALSVGLETAKNLSYVFKKPFIPVSHIEAHIYSVLWRNDSECQYIKSIIPTISPLPASAVGKASGRNRNNKKKLEQKQINQEKKISYPALALVVSGGHTELILIKKFGQYRYLGRTLDDAAGEAFDKTAKILGLPYPGGPSVSSLAQRGDPQIFKMPMPMLKSGDYNFSFSGIKTHILYLWQSLKPIQKRKAIANICASFEQSVVNVLTFKTINAAKHYQVKTVLAVGGVSANQKLRYDLQSTFKKIMPKTKLLFPDLSLCGDNAGMIGIVGALRFQHGELGDIFKIKVQPKLKLE